MRREDLVRAVAVAVEGVPGVDRLHPGSTVEAATHFAGGKVVGIRLGDPVEIHIVAGLTPLPAVSAEVVKAAQRVLSAAGDQSKVTVFIEDVTERALERRR